MHQKPLFNAPRRIRRRTLAIVAAVALLPAAFGVGFGGRFALQAYSTIAAHNAPVACGGLMQPCVPIRR